MSLPPSTPGFVPHDFAASGAPTAPQPTPERLELGQVTLFSELWRRKWIVGLFVIGFGALGAYYATQVAQPLYASTTRLAFKVRNESVVDIKSVMSGVSSDKVAINTELAIIKSRGLITQLVEDMALTEDPEFNPRVALPAAPGPLDGVKGWIKARLFPSAGAQPEPSAEKVKESTISRLRNVIKVTPQRDTFLFDIRVTSANPLKAAEIANRLGALYIQDQVRIKFEATEYAVNWLTSRVSELERDLKAKEDAIKALRAETSLISVEALEALNQRSKDIRSRLTEATLDQQIAQTALDGLSQALTAQDDAALRLILNEAPEGEAPSRAVLLARAGRLLEQRQAEAQRRDSQRAALEESYGAIQAQIAQQNKDFEQLTKLSRDADATRVLYETFFARLKETSIQIGLQQADSRVLSRAVGAVQVAPKTVLLVLLSAFLGALLAGALVMLLAARRRGFRTSSELARDTGTHVLGQVPRMPTSKRKRFLPYLLDKPTSATNEAFRNIRTSLMMARVDQKPKVIMSTSSVPGEGKTTLSIALAHKLASLDKKVLLIDGDVRRRTLNEYFSIPGKKGLISVVTGEATLDEVRYHAKAIGVDVLRGDHGRLNAADFFASDRFRDFLEQVKASYDFVVIDTPPVLVVPDSRIVGSMVDAVVYSVAWDKTARVEVLEGLNSLRTAGVDVTGLVLGQVNLRRLQSYGYGHNYGAYSGYYDN